MFYDKYIKARVIQKHPEDLKVFKLLGFSESLASSSQESLGTEEEFVFRSYLIYHEIAINCDKVPDETRGEWVWYDNGTPRSDLPPCEVGKVALT